jgi:glycosyltransferase involved in cell wall biosynthesis
MIHFHGIDCLEYLPEDGPAALITLHLPLAWYPAETFTMRRRNTFLQGVSKAQQQTAPGVALSRVIENGVDLARYRPGRRQGKYAMILGRICPEKGIDIAMRACRAAGASLLIGGRVYGYEDHQRYFAAQIEPLLDRHCRFLGELDRARKSRLLAAAQCLLAPSLAPETSSLVAMEALASGTPVIAFRSGALPDVVEHGITGWIVESEREMIAAIARAPSIDRSRCRLSAVQRFDQNRTIGEYFSLYDDICRWVT